MKNRRSIRKPCYDYSAPGDYFVTACTRNRDLLLGEIIGDRIFPSAFGVIVRDEWVCLPERFPGIGIDAFTIMPNHIHAIVTLVGAPLAGARPVVRPNEAVRGNSHTTVSGITSGRVGA